jgi:hypothetical protein
MPRRRKKEQEAGENYDELHDLYSSPNIIREIISRMMMGLAGILHGRYEKYM